MKNVELLAPAGTMDGLKSAVAFGADAVYLGGQNHNARINAKNFDEQQIKDAIKYVRLRGKRVYVTINTLFFEHELDGLAEYVNELQDMGANAVILQDLGAVRLIAENCTIPIHASTQMGIHNLDGCRFAENMGFERAILSRETPLEEIRHIRENSNIELETFVHGALCGCFSGQCYYSHLKGGRSGNRGDCAQPCRLEHKGYGYPLSTKDLMALELLPQLINSGITSFKIEGRMKRPAYAGIVTDVYRKAIDLIMNNEDIPVQKYKQELIKIYNRGGFTKGYYLDNKDIFGSGRPNHMGERVGTVTAVKKNKIEIKSDKEIHVYDGLSFGREGMEISDLYENGRRVTVGSGRLSFSCILKGINTGDAVYRTTDRSQIEAVEKKISEDIFTIPIDMECTVNEHITLKLKADTVEVDVCSEKQTEAARTKSLSKDDVLKSVSKLGDTCFVLNKAEIKVKEGVFVSASELNALRRKAVETLEKQLIKGRTREKIVFEHHEIPRLEYIGNVVIGIDSKKHKKGCELFLVYPQRIDKGFDGADGIVLPGVSFEEDLQAVESAVSKDDIVVCNNISQIERLRGKCRLWAGAGMNCTNSLCAKELYSLGCEAVISSIEADVPHTLRIRCGRIPAMTFVSCPKKTAVGCEECRKQSITGAKGREFVCVRLKNTYSFLLHEYKGNLGQVEYI